MEKLYKSIEIYKDYTEMKNTCYGDCKDFLNWELCNKMNYYVCTFSQAVEWVISEQEDYLLRLDKELQELRKLYSLEKNPVYIEIGNEYKKIIEIEKKRLMDFQPINYYKKLSPKISLQNK